jgi:hypothetical protein
VTEPTPAETRGADHRTQPPPLTRATDVWSAWWDDFNEWDGAALFTDLDTALAHSAHAYVGEEYSWQTGDDPDDEAPDARLTWEHRYSSWRLLDAGRATGVRVFARRVHTPADAPHGPQERPTPTRAGADPARGANGPQAGAQRRDCPACDAGAEHDECCPTPETHNWDCPHVALCSLCEAAGAQEPVRHERLAQHIRQQHPGADTSLDLEERADRAEAQVRAVQALVNARALAREPIPWHELRAALRGDNTPKETTE